MCSILHFIQLLHNTLQKLQRVDVFDEVPDSLGASADIPFSEMDQPSFKILSTIPFDSTLVGGKFVSVSAIRQSFSSVKSRATNGDVHEDIVGKNDVSRNDVSGNEVSNGVTRTPPTSSVMMSPFAAYDSYHHCDDCKSYREGLGSSSFTKHSLTLGTGEQLTFVIPNTRREWFVFNEKNELRSLKLPTVTRASACEAWKMAGPHSERTVTMSPVFMPSIRRSEQGVCFFSFSFCSVLSYLF